MAEQRKTKTTKITGDYERHQQLYEKKMALLRESVQFVEQKRKMKSSDRRYLPSNFERVIACLKKNQADVDNVNGKNQQLLHMVEEMLQPKQSDQSSACYLKTQGLASVTECLGADRTSLLTWIKNNVGNPEDSLHDNRKVAEHMYTETEILEDVITHSCPTVSEDSEDTKTSEEMCNNVSEVSKDLAYNDTKMSIRMPSACVSSQSEEIAVKLICSEPFLQCKVKTNSENALQNALKSALQSVDNNSGIIVHESDQNHIVLPSTAVDILEQYTEDVFSDYSEKQQITEHFAEHQTRFLEQEGSNENHNCPPQELSVSEKVSALDVEDEDEIIIKRSRGTLSLVPSREKLKILDNIYAVIFEHGNTWQHNNKHICNPRLVFSILEAAKMGNEKVEEVLGSECSGMQLVICYKAICELIFAFPEENLLPTKFVKEYLLAMETPKICEDLKKNDTLMAFQDEESALFWSALIHHARNLVMQDLATITKIASIISSILLSTSRGFEDLLSTEEFSVARLNFSTFITQLLTEEMEGPHTSYEKDCCREECVVSKGLTLLNMHEEYNSMLPPVVEKVETDVNQEVIDDSRSSSFLAHEKTPSCLSCKLIMRVLLCKKSKGKHI